MGGDCLAHQTSWSFRASQAESSVQAI